MFNDAKNVHASGCLGFIKKRIESNKRSSSTDSSATVNEERTTVLWTWRYQRTHLSTECQQRKYVFRNRLVRPDEILKLNYCPLCTVLYKANPVKLMTISRCIYLSCENSLDVSLICGHSMKSKIDDERFGSRSNQWKLYWKNINHFIPVIKFKSSPANLEYLHSLYARLLTTDFKQWSSNCVRPSFIGQRESAVP